MDSEARKKRRKRNQYRSKLTTKETELEKLVAEETLLKLLGDEQLELYKMQSLRAQIKAVHRKIARLGDILASLLPAFRDGKGKSVETTIHSKTTQDTETTRI